MDSGQPMESPLEPQPSSLTATWLEARLREEREHLERQHKLLLAETWLTWMDFLCLFSGLLKVLHF